MKLEQQVCSLELAKRLKELGVKQDGVFYWIRNAQYGDMICYGYPPKEDGEENGITCVASALTVAELGDMLPDITKSWRYDYMKDDETRVWEWACEKDYSHDNPTVEGTTEADARAKMLIYLIENHLITL
jgi:hypothetical protein